MADSGLKRFISQGIRFALTKGAATYVGVKTAVNPTTSFYFNLPTTLPPTVTQALTVDTAGNMGYTNIGGGGSVTSIGLVVPSDMTATAAITTSGNITISRNNQAANLVLVGPTTGVAAAPTFRALVAADIPSLIASKITDFDTQVRLSRLDQMAAPTAAVALNSQRITGLATPTAATDAATKGYVDGIAQSLDIKQSVRVASTANVNVNSPGAAIDGVTLVAGDRVLLKNQTAPAQNGIYEFIGSALNMVRTLDADTSTDLTSGAFTFVSEGTTNADTGWVVTTDDTITIGTTAINWTQFNGAGAITDGNGLVRTGNVLDVVGTANRITASANSIDIASTYVGQTSITTLGTISTGTWAATDVAIAHGGTGASTAAAARTNLSAAGVFRTTFTNASLTAGILTVTHNLGSQFCDVRIYDDTNQMILDADAITATSATVATVNLTSMGTISGTWNVVVVG